MIYIMALIVMVNVIFLYIKIATRRFLKKNVKESALKLRRILPLMIFSIKITYLDVSSKYKYKDKIKNGS
jgi:hypothetical protein